jgi:simple sugar transport system permease protein
MKRRLRFERRPAAGAVALWVAPLAAFAVTVLACMALFAWLGRSPAQVVEVFFVAPLSSVRAWGEVGLKAAPLILCSVGLTLCFRANVWNIGAEGQLIAGAIAGGGVALLAGAAAPRAYFVVVLLAAAGGGMAWAAIAAWLRDRFNANEILVTLMLVYVAQLLLAYIVRGPWRDAAGFGFPQTAMFAAPARLPIVVGGTRLHIGMPVALAAAAAAWWLVQRSVIGLQLRVNGLAPRAARYAGFSARRTLWFALLCSGALAGLAGGAEAAGPIGQLTPAVSPGYGFAAIIVAFAGRLHPVGVCLAGFVMALLYIGGELAQSRLGMPAALTGIMQGTLLFALLACDALARFRPRIVPRASA